ncbi:MAG: Transposase family protein [Hydrocarboniphaga sp.]|uniref:IS110 family transposase n=1 Tax=Hydrocarboniphaga sp. TaxID=2033016 RepID=UPI00261E7B23|nr:IS110 family transposase [Hydrocarboniphaga sp.]MDB5970209.1 Transposase family protein [Hydrocarboniphaga sp.]
MMKDVTTIAVDLAKDVFQVAYGDGKGRVLSRQRIASRRAFALQMGQWRDVVVVMESCATAHYWGRECQRMGLKVRLLPAQHVGAYRRRNKTDAADAEALLEANRNAQIKEVPVKNQTQQLVLAVHSLREGWKAARVARINALRGHLLGFGQVIPLGADKAIAQAAACIEKVPDALHGLLHQLLDEIGQLSRRMADAERPIIALNKQNPAATHLQQISGIGPLTASALTASAVDARHFKNGRQLAAWLGLTPLEHSSGNNRHLGRISKRGDVYVRMLLVHGARSALSVALALRNKAPDKLNRVQLRATQLHDRIGMHKAIAAVANKLARICWAMWTHGDQYDGNDAGMAKAVAA